MTFRTSAADSCFTYKTPKFEILANTVSGRHVIEFDDRSLKKKTVENAKKMKLYGNGSVKNERIKMTITDNPLDKIIKINYV